MAGKRLWNVASRARLTVMFLAVLLPPAVTLVVLGIELLQQDRTLQVQREMEGREAAAETVVRSLTQSLAQLQTPSPKTPMPEAAVELIVSGKVVRGQPAGRLLWTSSLPDLPEARIGLFDAAEKAEFQGDPQSALNTYRQIARSSNAAARAGALLRIARIARKMQRTEEALDAYRSLAAIHGIAIDQTPADFLARRAICGLLEDLGYKDELRPEAASLESDFLAGRWTLDRASWELAARQIEQWTGHSLPITTEVKALSAAADWFWERARGNSLTATGGQSVFIESTPIAIAWRREASQSESAQWTAVLIAPSMLRAWMQKASRTGSVKMGRLSVMTDSGELVAGDAPDVSSHAVKRNSSDTGLPWTLVLSSTNSSLEAESFAGRRRLLAWGLGAIVLLLAGGSYFLLRVIERELAVARLQTDFVAAVSHEFRTPLTSLRHVTELLEEDDGLPPSPEQERRKTFYAALARNTERLHRLVESLLDFSRMETGRKPWNMQPLDAHAFTAEVASEFQKEVEPNGVKVDLATGNSDPLPLRADPAALGHALWNVLDNAVKYSPQSHAVHVSVKPHPRGIAISVQDEGIGIPPQERREIFGKFVRGRKATELGIKGTGLGLAMVAHIVQAHGGAIELESEEGKGSTFRLVLPAGA